ncbi:MAG: DUF4097 family beta strand repeat-containing protein, partial [Bacillota bacterium]|nr:DUF4097 family beta strand repeat-containing protein [Bacillota bacterium]
DLMAEQPAAYGIHGEVRELEIRAGRADVRVRAGDAWRLDLPPQAEVSQEGSRVRIQMPRRAGLLFAALQAAELEVTVPATLAGYYVRTTGDVGLTGLAASGRVEVKAGDVRADSCSGELVIQSGAGDVEVVGHRGSLTIQSGAGDIEVRDGTLETLKLRSGAGDVDCAARISRQATIHTGAGSVTLRPETDGDAEIEVQSGFGDISLHLDGVRGGRLEMQTGAGSIDGDVGIRFGRRGGIGVHSADVLGPGSGRIRLTTGAGSIRLHGEPRAAEAAPARPAGPPGPAAEAGPTGPRAPAAPARRFGDAREVLEALARGEITTDEADRLLREM